VQSVFEGRVTGVRFGAKEGELWVSVPGSAYHLAWADNRVLGRGTFNGPAGVQAVAIDPVNGRALVTSIGHLPIAATEAQMPGTLPRLASRPAAQLSFFDDAARGQKIAPTFASGALGEYQVAVELRHSSWSDAFDQTIGLLNGAGAAWVQIDEPKFRFSIRQNRLPNVKGFHYMRLHGRNTAQWWKHDKSEDRYNYLYSHDELKDISETADAARRIVKKAYLYTNNHFSAKSVANAAMIKQQLGEPIEGEYPPEFVAQYPDLAGVVKVKSGDYSLTNTRRI
jgi:uncharacterized protein YecE (DUF72 family)